MNAFWKKTAIPGYTVGFSAKDATGLRRQLQHHAVTALIQEFLTAANIPLNSLIFTQQTLTRERYLPILTQVAPQTTLIHSDRLLPSDKCYSNYHIKERMPFSF